MISMSNGRVRNGIIIGIESIKLAYRNPIIWLYAVVPTLTALICHLYLASDFLKIIIEAITIIFFACGLARHTMHILRQQPASIHESFRWIAHHYKPVLFLILSRLAVIGVANLPEYYFGEAALKSFSGLPQFIFFVFMLGIAFIYLLTITLVIPIIATEKISFLPAFKRALHLIWHNFITYITRFVFLELVLVASVRLLFWSIGINATSTVGIPSDLGEVVLFPLFTIANTIFYYEYKDLSTVPQTRSPFWKIIIISVCIALGAFIGFKFFRTGVQKSEEDIMVSGFIKTQQDIENRISNMTEAERKEIAKKFGQRFDVTSENLESLRAQERDELAALLASRTKEQRQELYQYAQADLLYMLKKLQLKNDAAQAFRQELRQRFPTEQEMKKWYQTNKFPADEELLEWYQTHQKN